MPILVNLLEEKPTEKEERKKETVGVVDEAAFKSSIWPGIIHLCSGTEMPANTLYLIIKSTELWLKKLGVNGGA